jgi:hypothetical protein
MAIVINGKKFKTEFFFIGKDLTTRVNETSSNFVANCQQHLQIFKILKCLCGIISSPGEDDKRKEHEDKNIKALSL